MSDFGNSRKHVGYSEEEVYFHKRNEEAIEKLRTSLRASMKPDQKLRHLRLIKNEAAQARKAADSGPPAPPGQAVRLVRKAA